MFEKAKPASEDDPECIYLSTSTSMPVNPAESLVEEFVEIFHLMG
jgi:hypothetical protein